MSRAVRQVGASDGGGLPSSFALDDANDTPDAVTGFAASDFLVPTSNIAAAAALAGLVATPSRSLKTTPFFARGAIAASNALGALGRSVRLAISNPDAPIAATADDGEPEAPRPGTLGGSRLEWLEMQACALLAAFGLNTGRRPADAAQDTPRPSTTSGGASRHARDRRRVVPALASLEPVKKIAKPVPPHRKSRPRGWRVRRTLRWCAMVIGAGVVASLMWGYVLRQSQASSSDDGEKSSTGCSATHQACRR